MIVCVNICRKFSTGKGGVKSYLRGVLTSRLCCCVCPNLSCSSETRLLEIVESACEKTDFECNRLLEQIEDQVETWWFHR